MLETRIMKAFKEAKLEGKLEGKREGKLEAARNLLDVLEAKTIDEKIGLPIEEVKKLKLKLKLKSKAPKKAV